MDYEENFRKFFGVEDLINFSESDIKDLGVKNSSHRARIISSLVALKGEKVSQKFLSLNLCDKKNASRKFKIFKFEMIVKVFRGSRLSVQKTRSKKVFQ